MAKRATIYKWTRPDGTTGGRRLQPRLGTGLLTGLRLYGAVVLAPRILWRPGLVVRAKSRKPARILCSPALLHAFLSEDSAHRLKWWNTLPDDYTVLWEGEGYIYCRDDLKVGCRAMVLHRIIQGELDG